MPQRAAMHGFSKVSQSFAGTNGFASAASGCGLSPPGRVALRLASKSGADRTSLEKFQFGKYQGSGRDLKEKGAQPVIQRVEKHTCLHLRVQRRLGERHHLK
jgi:hypothetical protein